LTEGTATRRGRGTPSQKAALIGPNLAAAGRHFRGRTARASQQLRCCQAHANGGERCSETSSSGAAVVAAQALGVLLAKHSVRYCLLWHRHHYHHYHHLRGRLRAKNERFRAPQKGRAHRSLRLSPEMARRNNGVFPPRVFKNKLFLIYEVVKINKLQASRTACTEWDRDERVTRKKKALRARVYTHKHEKRPSWGGEHE